MSKAIGILMAILILMSVFPVSAIGQHTVVKKELVDSQYGFIGDVLGFGNREYKITYSDGTTENVMVTGSSLFKGAIVEQPSGTSIWSSVCYNAKIDYRIKTIQDSAGSYTDNHKIEVWENDLGASVDLLSSQFPAYKVYDSNSFVSSTSISTPYTIQIPYRAYAANQRFPMMVVEYQQHKDGTWTRLANPGYGATSTLMIDITWSSSYQSGGGVGSLTGGSCSYTAPQPGATTSPTAAPPTNTVIRVTSDPTGAVVTSDGATLGTTPFDLTLTGTTAKILTFTKAGYTTTAKGISSTSGTPFIATLTSTSQPTPIATTAPTVAPAIGGGVTPIPIVTTPAATTPASTDGSGTLIQETEPAGGSGGATVTYEEPTIFTSTNIFIALILTLFGVVGYSMYVQKGGKKKGRR